MRMCVAIQDLPFKKPMVFSGLEVYSILVVDAKQDAGVQSAVSPVLGNTCPHRIPFHPPLNSGTIPSQLGKSVAVIPGPRRSVVLQISIPETRRRPYYP
jgi:hypothetical protein